MKSEPWQEVERVRGSVVVGGGGLRVAAQLRAKTATEASGSSEISVPAPVPFTVLTHTHTQAPGPVLVPDPSAPLQEKGLHVCVQSSGKK